MAIPSINLNSKKENYDVYSDNNQFKNIELENSPVKINPKKFKDITKKIHDLQNQVFTLNQLLKNYKEDDSDNKDLIKEKDIKINELTKELDEKNEVIDKYEATTANKDFEIVLLKNKNRDLEEKSLKMQKEIDNLNSFKSKENQNAYMINVKLEKTKNELTLLKNKIKEKEKYIGKLKNDLNKFETDNSHLKHEFNDNLTELVNLNNKIKSCEGKIKDYVKSIQFFNKLIALMAQRHKWIEHNYNYIGNMILDKKNNKNIYINTEDIAIYYPEHDKKILKDMNDEIRNMMFMLTHKEEPLMNSGNSTGL